ncbi:hypothetical protein ACFONI_09950 [Aeromonas media]
MKRRSHCCGPNKAPPQPTPTNTGLDKGPVLAAVGTRFPGYSSGSPSFG